MSMPDLQDAVFGALKWNERFSWYEAEMPQADGKEVRVRVTIKDADTTTAIRRARAMYDVIRQHEPAYREAAKQKLLDLHGDSDDDEDTLDAEAFLTRVHPASLVIQVPGGARVYYDSGGFLEGHQVVVVLAENSSIRTVTIEG
jgi:hypothetical protein